MKLFDPIIKAALQEDIGPCDITTEAFIPKGVRFYGEMRVKSSGIICGAAVAKRVFELAAPGSKVKIFIKDGARVKKGDALLAVEGSRAILTAERTALNFLQHLSGVATKTGLFVKALKGGKTKIYDTRKTLPGLRALEKYAVKCGGGANHRMGLYDAFLIKDNHIAMLGGDAGLIGRKISVLRKTYSGVKIEIEAQGLAQFKAFLPLGADIIMLDNMSYPDMKKAIALARSFKGTKPEIEISGGVDLKTAGRLSALGADRISAGCITNSAGTLDISFEVKRL
ncbi:MAG: carboxylating nicotinate-nucleotide diphosphorylase [Elusimicrobia bacterium]|nr:carboxylating nicotinate-nucleotide diphosphorylase [Elusimicrobiota bacterium]